MVRELIRAIAAYCVDNDVPQSVFLITPALARILARLNVQLTEVGPPCDYRGIRFPYVCDTQQVHDTLSDAIKLGKSESDAHPYKPFSQLEREGFHREARK
jgi:hypothetical protein